MDGATQPKNAMSTVSNVLNQVLEHNGKRYRYDIQLFFPFFVVQNLSTFNTQKVQYTNICNNVLH